MYHEHSPIRTRVDSIISKQSTYTEVKQPTKLAQMLEIFIDQGFAATLSDLAVVFDGSSILAQQKLSFLNKLLSQLDLEITRESMYQLVKTDSSANLELTIQTMIDELRELRDVLQPTKQEQLLIELTSNEQSPLSQLAKVFPRGQNPKRLAQQKLHEISLKLAPYGLDIVRQTVYRITPISSS